MYLQFWSLCICVHKLHKVLLLVLLAGYKYDMFNQVGVQC